MSHYSEDTKGAFSTLRALGFAVVVLAAPAVFAETYFVAGENGSASDSNPGTESLPWKTLSKAAETLQPGDVAVIDHGVYRERGSPARGGTSEDFPIVYRAKKGASVVVKGSEVWKPNWRSLEGKKDIYSAKLDESLFAHYEVDDEPALLNNRNPFRTRISVSNGQDKMVKPTTGLAISLVARPAKAEPFDQVLGQLYADGKPLVQVTSQSELVWTPESYLVGANGDEIFIHWPEDAGVLSQVLFEITTRSKVFAPKTRGLGYIHLEGITFEHAANQGPFPQVGAVSVRSGHDWVIRDCTIRYAQTLGLDVGSEFFDDRLQGGNPRSRGHVIEGNTISDNGLCGIAGYNCENVRITGNRVERNNRLGFIQGLNAAWEEYAGIKILQSRNVLIADNLVQDNRAFGIWFDNQWQGSRITRNLVLGNQLAGIFIEFGKCPDLPLLIDNNVVAFTSGGHGIYCHDASDVVVANNLSYRNSDWGIWMWTISPRGEPGGCSNNRILNNIVYGNGAGTISLPTPGTLNENNVSDFNLVDGYATFSGVKPAIFQMNLTQGKHPTKKDALISRVLDAYEKNNVPASQRFDTEYLSGHPVVFEIDMWRTVSGNDLNSRMKPFQKSTLRSGIPDFECIWGEGFDAFCKPVPGITLDYFGSKIPANASYPGPFQGPRVDRKSTTQFEQYSRDKEGKLTIQTKQQIGRNRFVLWPKLPISSWTEPQVTQEVKN